MVQARNVFARTCAPRIAGTRSGCSSSSTTPAPTPSRRYPRLRLYVGRTMAAPVIVQNFAPPFSAASTAAVAFKDGTRQTSMTSRRSAAAGSTSATYLPGTVRCLHPAVLQCQRVLVLHNGRRDVNGPEGIDVDGTGNLYVANRNVPSITIYNAPLERRRARPAVTIPTGAPVGLSWLPWPGTFMSPENNTDTARSTSS